MSLVFRNVLFTVIVPGAGAIWIPYRIINRHGPTPTPGAWIAIVVIVAGIAIYLWCVRLFAVVGRGTPGPWDPPRRFVAVGPYRWVRNPIYIGAIVTILGEAWLFASVELLLYAAVMAASFHLFVIVYEERVLLRRFGDDYGSYSQVVSRWLPRRPT